MTLAEFSNSLKIQQDNALYAFMDGTSSGISKRILNTCGYHCLFAFLSFFFMSGFHSPIKKAPVNIDRPTGAETRT